MSLAPPAAHPERITACPICASNRLYYVFSTGACRVIRCNDCGLFAASPSESISTAGRAFQSVVEVSTDDMRTAVAGTAWPVDTLLQWITRYRGRTGGRLLLVGCGDVALARRMLATGYDLTLVEANPDARDRAADALGATVRIHRSVTDLPPSSQDFDLAVLDGALNNTPQPAALLRAVHALLSPGGVVLATVPGITLAPRHASTDSAAMPIRPGCFAFGSETLQSILFQNGFRGIVALPGTRDRRVRPPTGPCAVIAQRAPMRPRPLLSVVLPAFNEAATVETILKRLQAKRIAGVDLEIVIVESNSTDGTREIVQRFAGADRMRVILEDRPRGKGHAVRTGLQQATGDFILIQDADLEYDLEDYDVLLEPLLAGRESFVLGARHGGQTWKIRQFNDQPVQALILNLAHGLFTGMINLSLGLSLKDPFTMYKVFRRDCLHGLTFECNRFDFDWELLIKLVRRGHVPLEIPVNYRSRSFKEGKKVSVFRDPLTWIAALVRNMRARIDLLDTEPPTQITQAGADAAPPA